MNKSLFFLIFSISLTTGFLAQGYSPKGTLLWEVKKGKKTSYLFGTIHSNDKRLFNLPDSVYFALLATRQMAVEVDVFSLFKTKDPRKKEEDIMLDQKGNIYTSTNRPTETYYGNEDGYPQFMDAFFQQFAESSNRTVFPLETIYEQTKSLSEIPFQEDVNAFNALSISKERLLEIYLSGHLETIDRVLRGAWSSNKEAYNQLIVERNKKMSQQLDSLFKSEATFCAVGAGHLFGKEGLIQQLRNKGYLLRPINSAVLDPSFKSKVLATSGVDYSPKFFTEVVVSFPGKPRVIQQKDKNEVVVFKELGQGNTYLVEVAPRDTAISLLEYAEYLITSPPNSTYKYGTLDDGTEFVVGLGDDYPDGLKWIRITCGERCVVVSKAYGGNKFMNSNRPMKFFNQVRIFEE